MRAVYSAIALGVLAACSPAVPDSGAGIGFNNSPQAKAARDAELTGQPLPAASTVTSQSLAPAAVGAPIPLPAAAQPLPSDSAAVSTGTLVVASSLGASGTNADIANETAAALQLASANSGTMPVQASPSNPAPVAVSNPAGISDENDFSAVSQRESIESDAARIAANAEAYQVVAPTAVPTRDSAGSPNIVSYALQTNNPLGNRQYSRSGVNLAAKSQRNCAAFASPDQAQIAFLDKGGPQKDRQALDPDGDGYACDWDPTPFRKAVQN